MRTGLNNSRQVALRASLVLNVFLLALIVAYLVRAQVAEGTAHPEGEGIISRLTAVLPAEDAARFRAQLDLMRPQYEPQRKHIGEARQVLLEAIARDPYDPSAVRQALDDYQQSWRDFTSRFNQAFLAALDTVSPHGRAKLAAAAEMARGGKP